MIKFVFIDNYFSDLFTEVSGKMTDFKNFELLRQTLNIKENFSDNIGHNILILYDVLANFSLTMKQIMIIRNNHGIYELPYELSNELKLRILRK